MTEPLFFDTDCLSAFLWTDQGSIVTRLYPHQIVIPQLVLDELNRVGSPVFQKRVATLINLKDIEIRDIDVISSAFPLYHQMTSHPEPGFKAIGKGEAAALSLAITDEGIVASNNFRDTAAYIRKYHLTYKTTGSILVEAYENALISLEEANQIWSDMIASDRWIGARTFSEFYDKPLDPLVDL